MIDIIYEHPLCPLIKNPLNSSFSLISKQREIKFSDDYDVKIFVLNVAVEKNLC